MPLEFEKPPHSLPHTQPPGGSPLRQELGPSAFCGLEPVGEPQGFHLCQEAHSKLAVRTVGDVQRVAPCVAHSKPAISEWALTFTVHPLNHNYCSICNVVSHGSFDLCFLDG